MFGLLCLVRVTPRIDYAATGCDYAATSCAAYEGGTVNGRALWLPSFLEYLQLRAWVVSLRMECIAFELRHVPGMSYAAYGLCCVWVIALRIGYAVSGSVCYFFTFGTKRLGFAECGLRRV